MEIEEALKLINKYHNKVIILHCVSEYPTSLRDVNLSRIIKLKKSLKKFNWTIRSYKFY